MFWRRKITAAVGVTLAIAAAGLGCGGAETEPVTAAEAPAVAPQSADAVDPPPVAMVPMTIYLMSQCPYAARALPDYIDAAQELGVDLDVEYIGRINGDQLSTMHGESELQGNLQQVCARRYSPRDNWLGLLRCQVRSFHSIPDNFEGCAQQHGIDVVRVRRCANGPEGQALLRASYEEARRRGARGSPTFYFGDERYEGPRTTLAFARGYCATLGEARPASCSSLPPPIPVPAVLVVDRRCQRPACRQPPTELDELARLRQQVPGLEVSLRDVSSPEGRALFEAIGARWLPLLVVGPEIEQIPGSRRLIERMEEAGERRYLVLGRFDPSAGRWIEHPEVSVQLLVDSRCKTRECESVDRFESFIDRQLEKAAISRLDYVTDLGEESYQKIHRGYQKLPEEQRSRPLGLPLVILSRSLTDEPEVYERMSERLVELDDSYLFQLGPWDPEAEICDNSTDDDDDQRVDCRDPDCRDTLACRREKQRRLELFAMSECPYARGVLRGMPEVLEAFSERNDRLGFQIRFVGRVGDDGELISMHGEGEVEEDLRMICAQKLYPRNHLFMDYVACRARQDKSAPWEQCVTGPMKAGAIRGCAEGEVGQRLLKRDFERAKRLGISGSPSWLVNFRHEMHGRAPADILRGYCEHNEMPECESELSSEIPPPDAAAQ